MTIYDINRIRFHRITQLTDIIIARQQSAKHGAVVIILAQLNQTIITVRDNANLVNLTAARLAQVSIFHTDILFDFQYGVCT